jgi:hypothetical protein
MFQLQHSRKPDFLGRCAFEDYFMPPRPPCNGSWMPVFPFLLLHSPQDCRCDGSPPWLRWSKRTGAERSSRAAVLRTCVRFPWQARIVKLLWWDGDGLCLFAKRLERGRFIWPKVETGTVRLSRAQLSMLLEGIDWRRVERTWTPEIAV